MSEGPSAELGKKAPPWPLSWIGSWHQRLIFQRRVHVLARNLAEQIPQNASVLDVGCGDGTVGSLIHELRPDVAIQGVEVLARPTCKIPCSVFDGDHLPFEANSFDVCLFVDVLHHTNDPRVLLREAARVSRRFVLLKDHLDENRWDHSVLKLMDWVGNRPHGVTLTYNYQSERQWIRIFEECGLRTSTWETDVPLYVPPVSWIAGRKLHLIALCEKK